MISFYSAVTLATVILLCWLLGKFIRLLNPLATSVELKIDGQQFPAEFLWATGEDAYQHEGNNFNNDWHAWEQRQPTPIANGEVCGSSVDFYHRYEEDFKRAQSGFQNAHRIGLEWSRLEPREGEYDEAAFLHYEKILQSLQQKNFTVILNIWHFTLPLWAAKKGGWANPQLMQSWEQLVSRVSQRFGKYAHYWSTMIDAQIYALLGYGSDEIPPARKNLKLAIQVYRTLIQAHARAYHIIKRQAGHPQHREPQVGQIYFFQKFDAQGIFIDCWIARKIHRLFNLDMLRALHTGYLDFGIPLVNRVREFDPQVKGTLDFIGVNYYAREIVSLDFFAKGFISRKPHPRAPVSDMNWEIYPEGLHYFCRLLTEKFPDIPLFITESGIADANDSKRPAFILQHLAWLREALRENCRIIGFTYWSLTDNWEWNQGFGPKFGLYRVNLKTLEREETGSARLFRFICRNNRLPNKDELAENKKVWNLLK